MAREGEGQGDGRLKCAGEMARAATMTMTARPDVKERPRVPSAPVWLSTTIAPQAARTMTNVPRTRPPGDASPMSSTLRGQRCAHHGAGRRRMSVSRKLMRVVNSVRGQLEARRGGG